MACINQSASSYGLASWMHPQQGGLPAKKQKSCPYRSKYWGSFSMCILLTVLKHERQQCQYKHTENHKILECKIYHRHHLHSLRMKATPPCTTVVKIILSHKHIFSNFSVTYVTNLLKKVYTQKIFIKTLDSKNRRAIIIYKSHYATQ